MEAFGLRNAATDGAIGSSKDLKKGLRATAGQIKARRELGVATAIMCMGKQVGIFCCSRLLLISCRSGVSVRGQD